jgi:hypothetical protein
VSRYVDLLRGLKDPQRLVVAAIAGPVPQEGVTVGRDEYDQPEVQFSCTTSRGGATPGIRLKAFVEVFNREEELIWAFSPQCSVTFTDALEGIGRQIGRALHPACPAEPLAGCADPAAALGLPGDGQSCNDQCRAECEVEEVLEPGTPNETVQPVPPCLEVCSAGPCSGNTDPTLAYAGGHPLDDDPALPVPRCWHVGYQPDCPQSNRAELRISRRVAPPPRSRIQAWCTPLPVIEAQCDDGQDNDEDCLVDGDDPDCSG